MPIFVVNGQNATHTLEANRYERNGEFTDFLNADGETVATVHAYQCTSIIRQDVIRENR